MSDLKADGFKSSELITNLASALSSLSEAEKKAQIKKTNGIFELEVKNDKETVTWTIDMKNEVSVYKGKAKPKADVTIILSDDTLVNLSSGKLSGQEAFMKGKLKTRGNMMMATKLGAVLQNASAKNKAKL